jgi:hypothetical protein
MDAWSDQNRRSYLAITAHWIGRVGGTTSLQLKAALIAFHRLRVEIGRGNPGVTKLPPVPLPAETRDPPQG